MIIVELLRQGLSEPHAYTWTRQDAKRHEAVFTIGGINYWASAYQTSAMLPTHSERVALWILNFGVSAETSQRLHGHPHAIMKPTKLGGPHMVMAVLATVRAIFEDFVQHVRPENLWFSDIDKLGGRKRWYQRFAQLLITRYGYVLDAKLMAHFHDQSVWLLQRHPGEDHSIG